ncbi:MAG: high-affinity branched-chain amino acid ABC transporter permease LivM [Magnetococcales bacterium]|nr:high-affinity branched-chain amino acid ABC transporter permease LivM [Magnetococcales bacterium]
MLPLWQRVARTGFLAWLVFLPLTGLHLERYEVSQHWQNALWLAMGVALLHLLWGGLAETSQGQRWIQQLAPRASAGVVVGGGMQSRWPLLLVVLLAFLLPFFVSKYWLNVATLAMIYVLLGVGLNIVVGLAGLLDLGYVAFYAVGAYGYGLGAQYLGLNFWQAIPFAALLAALLGAVLGFPVLRMHGDYLAIVTLGFGEIIRLVLNNWGSFTGGPNGVAVPFPSIPGLSFNKVAKPGERTIHDLLGIPFDSSYKYIFLYLVLLIMVVLVILAVSRIRTMPIGRAWEALREDEIACRSLGINHVVVKLSAFSLGALCGGIGGVFFAASQGFINPHSFTFFESAMILAIVVLGGMGSIVGVVAAAVTLTVLPELLREFADYRVLVFGLAMVGMMIWRPRGLLRLRRPHFPVSAP